jgi:hypothetical protein
MEWIIIIILVVLLLKTFATSHNAAASIGMNPLCLPATCGSSGCNFSQGKTIAAGVTEPNPGCGTGISNNPPLPPVHVMLPVPPPLQIQTKFPPRVISTPLTPPQAPAQQIGCHVRSVVFPTMNPSPVILKTPIVRKVGPVFRVNVVPCNAGLVCKPVARGVFSCASPAPQMSSFDCIGSGSYCGSHCVARRNLLR